MIQTQMTKAQWEKLNAMASIATVLLKEDLASAQHDSSPYRHVCETGKGKWSKVWKL
jgi:hypothetical protein